MENKLKQAFVSELIDSYIAYPVSQSQFRCELPNKAAIMKVTDRLIEVLLPGYFGEVSPKLESLPCYIGEIIQELEPELIRQLILAIKRYNCEDNTNEIDISARAEDICLSFLKKLPELRMLLSFDVQAAYEGDPAALDKDQIVFCYPGIFAIAVYRLAHELLNLDVPYIPRIMTEYAHSKTGIDIHPGAKIGKYFFIDHGTGVVIGETTIIGDYVKLYQGVTLGGLSTKGGRNLIGSKRHPTIEDNVTIYSGATVLGGDTIIGENVTIGGNEFIRESRYKRRL